MTDTMIFQAARAMWADAIELHMAVRRDGVLSVAQPVVMQPADEAVIHAPFLRVDVTAAQRLMDELWHCGLRPTEELVAPGVWLQLNATCKTCARLFLKASHDRHRRHRSRPRRRALLGSPGYRILCSRWLYCWGAVSDFHVRTQ